MRVLKYKSIFLMLAVLFFFLYGICEVSALSVQEMPYPGQKLNITGTFVLLRDGDYKNLNWTRQHLELMNEAGIDTVIIMWIAYRQGEGAMPPLYCYYPTGLTHIMIPFPGIDSNNDPVDNVFKAAEELQMDVIIAAEPLRSTGEGLNLSRDQAISNEIYSLYGNYASFRGWYFSNEYSDAFWGDPVFLAAYGPYYRDFTIFLHSISGKPVSMAPYFHDIGTDQEAQIWDNVLDMIPVDVLNMQDGVGCYERIPINKLSDYYAKLNQVCKSHNTKLWTDLEVFYMPNPNDPYILSPVDMQRVARQIEEEEESVEKITVYQWSQFMGPADTCNMSAPGNIEKAFNLGESYKLYYDYFKRFFREENLALNKTATASSYSQNAYLSVDRDAFTRWGSIYADNQWYKVDLGVQTVINKVVINWEFAYDTEYSVQVSTDDANYTTVYSTESGDGGVDVITFPDISARYVRILCTKRATGYGSSFWELGVFYSHNIALNKTATASSYPENAYLSVDGNPYTRWGSIYVDNQWYKVDLGVQTVINKVVINWENAYDTEYSVQISVDNANYTTVYSTASGDGGVDVITFPDTDARYVRILCTKRATGYGSSFWELGVYYCPSRITSNLALNRSATASSSQSGNFNPDRAVDGNPCSRWGSIYVDNQWYKVDLGVQTVINKVVINWENAYDTEYSVQISVDNANYTTVYSTESGDGGVDVITFPDISARYVRVLCIKRATGYGSSFWELGVYKD